MVVKKTQVKSVFITARRAISTLVGVQICGKYLPSLCISNVMLNK